ncbi:MAG: XRE family transcriptional regulator [Treponema sp.]|nr:XRE family transcriptional regulator [Treponema sp.]
MGKEYHCDICMGIHESMRELFDIGLISGAEMRDFDRRCLVEKPGTDKVLEFPDVGAEALGMGHVNAQYSAGQV